MVFLEADAHGAFSLSYVGRCAGLEVVTRTGGMVDDTCLVGVVDGVFEVHELTSEGVLVGGVGAYVGLAEDAGELLRHASVEGNGNGGLVCGGSCGGR